MTKYYCDKCEAAIKDTERRQEYPYSGPGTISLPVWEWPRTMTFDEDGHPTVSKRRGWKVATLCNGCLDELREFLPH